MTLQQLLNIHGHLQWRQQDSNFDATHLVVDSRQLNKGDVFVAIRGTSGDGHHFLQKVCDEGASAVVVEDVSLVPANYQGAVVEVLDTRLALQVLSQRLFEKPGEQMKAIAVTGTNGKTSLTYLIEHLLNRQSSLCGVIGTINHHVGQTVWKTNLTTPDPVTLQKRLKEFVDQGADSFVIEASSHALEQHRIHQGFDVVLFNNLSRDHLDYHKTMESYFEAKAKLFSQDYLKEAGQNFAVINGDDPWGVQLKEQCRGREIFTFGKNNDNDFVFKISKQSLHGTEFTLTNPQGESLPVHSPLIGEHNVYNVVGALLCVYSLGADLKRAIVDLKDFAGIPGRLQQITNTEGVHAFVDYAHTPEALEKVAQAIKPYMEDGAKLITVFGCGGDRDTGKRPLMGKAAQDNSDVVVVTSDNPRSEDPQKIIEDILTGVDSQSLTLHVQADRRKAIDWACQQAKTHDVILVAGKGHEDYQIVGDKTLHFDDYQTLKQILSGQ